MRNPGSYRIARSLFGIKFVDARARETRACPQRLAYAGRLALRAMARGALLRVRSGNELLRWNAAQDILLRVKGGDTQPSPNAAPLGARRCTPGEGREYALATKPCASARRAASESVRAPRSCRTPDRGLSSCSTPERGFAHARRASSAPVASAWGSPRTMAALRRAFGSSLVCPASTAKLALLSAASTGALSCTGEGSRPSSLLHPPLFPP